MAESQKIPAKIEPKQPTESPKDRIERIKLEQAEAKRIAEA